VILIFMGVLFREPQGQITNTGIHPLGSSLFRPG
jgi:hypothetical protein